MQVVHLHAAQENILHDGEGNLNPSWSLAFSGFLTLWDKWGLLSALLTKATGTEVQNPRPGRGRAAKGLQYLPEAG